MDYLGGELWSVGSHRACRNSLHRRILSIERRADGILRHSGHGVQSNLAVRAFDAIFIYAGDPLSHEQTKLVAQARSLHGG